MMNLASATKFTQGMRERGETTTPNVEVVRRKAYGPPFTVDGEPA